MKRSLGQPNIDAEVGYRGGYYPPPPSLLGPDFKFGPSEILYDVEISRDKMDFWTPFWVHISKIWENFVNLCTIFRFLVKKKMVGKQQRWPILTFHLLEKWPQCQKVVQLWRRISWRAITLSRGSPPYTHHGKLTSPQLSSSFPKTGKSLKFPNENSTTNSHSLLLSM